MTETPAEYKAPPTVNTVYGRGILVREAMSGDCIVQFTPATTTPEQWDALYAEIVDPEHPIGVIKSIYRVLSPDKIKPDESESEE